MAEVILKNIKKIYPHQEPKKKKKGEPEKKNNLQITEEGVLAVDNFNLHIQDKEFIVLVGPSGCGKSTTLRMVAGLEEISGGELYIGGQLMNDVAPKDRDISMVFQNYACIARAMAVSPSVLLMDEPLSNLDAKLRNQMRAELIKLRQRINTTFIYVTHDQTEAMTLGDRIVIMKDGVIQQIGTPQEVFNHPANLFVAGFIGMPQMNFYDAELVLEDGQYAVVLDGAKVTLPEEKQAKLKANGAAAGPITLGVRPEHLILSGDEGSMIHGTVDVSEMMGSAVHLHVSACGSDTIMIVPTTELESTSAFTIGSPIAFTFNGVMAHLFDRNTQKNLEV